jgi:hypothetical protein
MDRRMMNQWLAAQSQKKQVTEASMQRKRLGIKEAVNYGDINFRVPVDPNTGQPIYSEKIPRSPESAANLTRRLETLYKAVGDTENDPRQQRIARMMMSKGVAPEGTGTPEGRMDIRPLGKDLVDEIKAGKPVGAGQLNAETRQFADESQVGRSLAQRERTLAAKQAAANRIGGSKLPKALGAAGAILALATGAQADILHSLHPLSVLDSGSLGTDDMMGEPIEFKEPAPKQQKPLPGAQYLYPAKMNENNMMKQWLKAQTQK